MEKMNIDTSYKVTMHNDLIKSKSDLQLNELKLLRLTIMNVMKSDTDFKTFQIKVTDLVKLLDIPKSDVYRDIDNLTTALMKKVVFIGDGNIKHKWKKFQWVSKCQYENGVITIQLHDDLKPYLLELKGLYTQYELADIIILDSVYSIRMYELIREALKSQKYYAGHEARIYLPLDRIRKATNTENKYKRYSQLYERVILHSFDEINRKTSIHTTHEAVKEGKKIVGYNVSVMSRAGWNVIGKYK